MIIWVPEGDPSGLRGWHYEHRWVMAKKLRRPLKTHETVHHKDGVRHHNYPRNLELWDKSHPTGQRVEDIVIRWLHDNSAAYVCQFVRKNAKLASRLT